MYKGKCWEVSDVYCVFLWSHKKSHEKGDDEKDEIFGLKGGNS